MTSMTKNIILLNKLSEINEALKREAHEQLGVLAGISGMAYQMLRFYDWENTPSLLCLETPKNMNYVLH